jgi:hypothetical protein
MAKTIQIPASELQRGDITYDINPESKFIAPTLFTVIETEPDLIMEIISGEGKDYIFSWDYDKPHVHFSKSGNTSWYKVI